MRYRKKPAEVEAWQFTKENYKNGAPSFIKHASGQVITLWSQSGGDVIGGEIRTLEGLMTVSEGDWIIKGITGEFYPCKHDIFELTYEPVNELEQFVRRWHGDEVPSVQRS